MLASQKLSWPYALFLTALTGKIDQLAVYDEFMDGLYRLRGTFIMIFESMHFGGL